MIFKHFLIFVINFLVCILFAEAESKCQFPLHEKLPKSIDFLNKLGNQTYEASDSTGSYLYKIGFCETPKTDATDTTSAAVYQYDKTNKKWIVVGRYNNTDLKTGNNWGLVEFGSGERYDTHCSSNERVAMIMITCNSGIDKPVLRVIEENTQKSKNCYYLFEIEHPKVCQPTPEKPATKTLGTGAIFAIILVSIIVLYICGGVAIKKVFTDTEGVELIPNIDFWRRCGTLFADGADWLCRPKPDGPQYQRFTGSTHNANNLTINDLDPADDDDEILALP